MNTVWIAMHDFLRFDLGRGRVNDFVAEFEFVADEYGNPVASTGNSRLVYK